MRKIFCLLSIFWVMAVCANDAAFLRQLVQDKEEVFSPVSKNHQLIFFFASTCPHCHHFAPVLKRWADKNRWQIQSFSLDGQPLPEFADIQTPDNELIHLAFQNEEIRYPALFVLNTTTHALYPVVMGEISFTELNDRMQSFIPKMLSYEGLK